MKKSVLFVLALGFASICFSQVPETEPKLGATGKTEGNTTTGTLVASGEGGTIMCEFKSEIKTNGGFKGEIDCDPIHEEEIIDLPDLTIDVGKDQ